MSLYAVKAIGNSGAIEAYGVRWGTADEPDRSRERDFFTPRTDLMLNEWGWPRPILLEHMVTPEGERAGSVGQWHGATKDRIGVKLRGQLDTAHPMYPPLARDIQAGAYFLSSDSAPHLVKRRPHPNGANELIRWGLLTASLTKTPAEHRLMPATMIKALALKAGARNAASDQAMLDRLLALVEDMCDQLCDHLLALGARPSDDDTDDLEGKSDPRAARIRCELEAIEIEERLLELDEQIRTRLLAELDTLEGK